MDGRERDYPEREQASEGSEEVQRHRRAVTPPDKKTFSGVFFFCFFVFFCKVVGRISGLS